MFDRDAFFEEWANALESGQKKQGRRKLHYVDEAGEERYCCLGVACELLYEMGLLNRVKVDENFYYEGTAYVLPKNVQQLLGIGSVGEFGHLSLATLNDWEEVSFSEIAEFIRVNQEKGLWE